MRSKKGIELAINMAVILILAVAVFTIGLYFAYNLLDVATDTADQLSEQHKQQIMNLIAAGSRIAVAPASMTIERSGTGFVGVGIDNVLDLGSESTFQVLLEYSWYQATPDSSLAEDGATQDDIKFTATTTKVIKNNHREILQIPVRVQRGARRGKYALTLTVQYSDPAGGWTDYGRNSKHKIYINVP